MITSSAPNRLRLFLSSAVLAASLLGASASALAAPVVATPAATAAPAIAIHPGDKVQITVFNHDNLSTQAVVNSTGNIPVPLAGDVSLGGLTQRQAAERIQAALSPYLRFPAVQVDILQQSQSVFFTGLLSGSQPYQPGETLGTAMSSLSRMNAPDGSGAFNTNGVNLRSVRIERDGAALPAVNLEALSRSGDPGPLLQPGDIILLAAKPVRVDVRGDIKTPGTMYLSEGDTLAQAVAQAGGFLSTASLNAIVLRRNGVERIVSSAGPDFNGPAHNGDVVTLRPAPHVSVVGMVEKPGDALLQNDTTLMGALYQAGGPSDHADLAHVQIMRAGQAHVYNISHLLRGDASQNVPVYDGDVILVPRGRSGINFDAVLGILGGLASLQLLLGH